MNVQFRRSPKLIFFSFFLCGFGVLTALSSCQKAVGVADLEPPSEQGTRTLPVQIGIHYLPGDYTETISLQYDTIHHAIRLFIDDTTTATPYDQLRQTYEYNPQGYLIRYTQYSADNIIEATDIIRSSDPTSFMIIKDYGAADFRDSAIWRISTSTTGYQVKKMQVSGSGQDPDLGIVYHYTTQWQLDSIQYLGYYASDHFQYDEGRLTGYTGGFYDGMVTMQLDYQSALPAAGKDDLLQLLLGRDYYLEPIRELYFLNLFLDPGRFALSGTDPNYPAALSYTHLNPGESHTSNQIYDFERNTDGQLTRILVDDDGNRAEITFKY